jgi:hypothetical protein
MIPVEKISQVIFIKFVINLVMLHCIMWLKTSSRAKPDKCHVVTSLLQILQHITEANNTSIFLMSSPGINAVMETVTCLDIPDKFHIKLHFCTVLFCSKLVASLQQSRSNHWGIAAFSSCVNLSYLKLPLS